MPVGHILVNYTKGEKIAFEHVSASSEYEIAGNPATTAIVSWYLLQNAGDSFAFVSDTYDDWPFSGRKKDLEEDLTCSFGAN